jgi:hypothetical protein
MAMLDIYGAQLHQQQLLKAWVRKWKLHPPENLLDFECMHVEYELITAPLLQHNSISFSYYNATFTSVLGLALRSHLHEALPNTSLPDQKNIIHGVAKYTDAACCLLPHPLSAIQAIKPSPFHFPLQDNEAMTNLVMYIKSQIEHVCQNLLQDFNAVAHNIVTSQEAVKEDVDYIEAMIQHARNGTLTYKYVQ